MRIIIAPDSFKGSLSAAGAAEALARGIRRVMPGAELMLLPLSDGGEGLVDALIQAAGGTLHWATVQGPLGDPVRAKMGILERGKTAVIEMAEASGLVLLPEERRNPLLTSSYGTGQLINEALDLGCSRLIIGIGGSATNDGGAGLASALGFRFLDQTGVPLGPGGAELARLAKIEAQGGDPRLNRLQIEVACDVQNPLTGPEGASRVYGPQKGATPEMVELLDRALQNFARVVHRDLGQAVDGLPGAGAAGGLGAGLVAFLGGTLTSGIELVLGLLDFAAKAQGAQLIITGEGKFDAQSAYGKVPAGVGAVGRRLGVPVVVVAGSVSPAGEALLKGGITAYFSAVPGPLALQEAMENAAEFLENQAEQIMRLFLAGTRTVPAEPGGGELKNQI